MGKSPPLAPHLAHFYFWTDPQDFSSGFKLFIQRKEFIFLRIQTSLIIRLGGGGNDEAQKSGTGTPAVVGLGHGMRFGVSSLGAPPHCPWASGGPKSHSQGAGGQGARQNRGVQCGGQSQPSQGPPGRLPVGSAPSEWIHRRMVAEAEGGPISKRKIRPVSVGVTVACEETGTGCPIHHVQRQRETPESCPGVGWDWGCG